MAQEFTQVLQDSAQKTFGRREKFHPHKKEHKQWFDEECRLLFVKQRKYGGNFVKEYKALIRRKKRNWKWQRNMVLTQLVAKSSKRFWYI